MVENFWIGDIVQIVDHDKDENGNTVPRIVKDVKGNVIPRRLTGNNYNWYVTDIYAPNDELTLGAYSSFGLKRNFSHPLTISSVDAKMIKQTCRHINTKTLRKVMPTCTESGLTEGKVCNNCGTMLVEQSVIPELGHLVEYDIDMGKKICTRCDWEESDKDRVVEFKAPDVRDLINIIEEMLGEDSDSEFPPLVYRTENLPAPNEYFSKDRYFHCRWSDDIASDLKWNFDGNFQFLTYYPDDASQDGTTPLIIWLHDYDGMDCDVEEFEDRGLPKILSTYWKVDETGLKKGPTDPENPVTNGPMQGFYSYILCPRMITGTWEAHKESFFHMIDSFVEKYQVDTSKIILMGEGMGGTGVEYFAYQKPDYFSCQIIIDGERSGVNLAQRYLSYDYDPINGRLDEYNDRILPTTVIAKNDHYSHHFIELNNVFGPYTDENGNSNPKFDGAYYISVLDYEPSYDMYPEGDEHEGEYNTTVKMYTFEELVAREKEKGTLVRLLDWAIEQTNEYAEPVDNTDDYIDKENGNYIQVPEEWLNVTQNNVPVRKGAGEFFSKVAYDVLMDYHQKIKLSKITRNGNELWGRFSDNEVWLLEESEQEELEKSGIWIDLSFTDYGLEPKDYKGYVSPVHYSEQDIRESFHSSVEADLVSYLEKAYPDTENIENIRVKGIVKKLYDLKTVILDRNYISGNFNAKLEELFSESKGYVSELEIALEDAGNTDDIDEIISELSEARDLHSSVNSLWKTLEHEVKELGKTHEDAYNKSNSGVVIELRKGAPVYCAAGNVTSITEDGKRITITHSFSYKDEEGNEHNKTLKTLYDNICKTDINAVESVSAGTLIGHIGDGGSEGATKELFYFELQEGLDDKPVKSVDPTRALQGLELSL